MSLLLLANAHATGLLGYGVVALAVGIESIGIPFPGETTLMAAAIYAGATHHLSIVLVIAAAVCGAILGDNIGYLLGRKFGFRLLTRYGRYVRITAPRIRLGQYLFLKHGRKVVFFGRFIGVLRALAAFLAGAMQMDWRLFLLYNAAGGAVWATIYGLGSYLLGNHIQRLMGPVGAVLSIASITFLAASAILLHRKEAALEAEAEQALPALSKSHRQLVRPLPPEGRPAQECARLDCIASRW